MADDDEQALIDVGDDDVGLAEPVFLIEHDGKFYLTVALWEYDDSDPTVLTTEQRAGVAYVRNLHAQRCRHGHHRAIKVTADAGAFAQHTNSGNP